MIHHLILLNEDHDVGLSHGKLVSGDKKIAIDVLGSVQSFSTRAKWSQSALEALSSQCPLVFARWNGEAKKWATCSMLMMLAYDTPCQRHQTFLRREFERMGGHRVQYSIYLFEGEPHECDRVIRYMRRVAAEIPGDIRLLPMEKSTWDAQIVISSLLLAPAERDDSISEFVKIW